ncbi:putative creatininase [Magnetospirillum sp. LM-5]|uniref:creatininase family protein n=1 Tax=Magnetospirillum sp. LM-5 TaxID=2681466 RepID=UPI0013852C30|nr:creatininase family protein [Magnetospirillum sp. LM-5]CAA7612673.1 putative creatininase [Magnetospirillum sp. LM-5]
MRLHLMTWPQVEAYLAHSTAIILPIGSTEQHGPTGLIGTDALCAEAVADKVGEALGVVVAPTLAIGMAQHHMAFPGTMTLKPSTLLAVVEDCLLSLVRHGFDRVLMINGHGGNVATINAAFSQTQMELDRLSPRPALRTRLVNWWETPEVMAASHRLFADMVGSHATPPEVALTWALHPDLADPHPLVPAVAPTGAFFGPADFRERFPDGRIGSNPSLASPEAGRELLKIATDEMTRLASDFFTQP